MFFLHVMNFACGSSPCGLSFACGSPCVDFACCSASCDLSFVRCSFPPGANPPAEPRAAGAEGAAAATGGRAAERAGQQARPLRPAVLPAQSVLPCQCIEQPPPLGAPCHPSHCWTPACGCHHHLHHSAGKYV